MARVGNQRIVDGSIPCHDWAAPPGGVRDGRPSPRWWGSRGVGGRTRRSVLPAQPRGVQARVTVLLGGVQGEGGQEALPAGPVPVHLHDRKGCRPADGKQHHQRLRHRALLPLGDRAAPASAAIWSTTPPIAPSALRHTRRRSASAAGPANATSPSPAFSRAPVRCQVVAGPARPARRTSWTRPGSTRSPGCSSAPSLDAPSCNCLAPARLAPHSGCSVQGRRVPAPSPADAGKRSAVRTTSAAPACARAGEGRRRAAPTTASTARSTTASAGAARRPPDGAARTGRASAT